MESTDLEINYSKAFLKDFPLSMICLSQVSVLFLYNFFFLMLKSNIISEQQHLNLDHYLVEVQA